MKKIIYGIILLTIVSLLAMGCNSVGAMQLPSDLNKEDGLIEEVNHIHNEGLDKEEVDQSNEENGNVDINENEEIDLDKDSNKDGQDLNLEQELVDGSSESEEKKEEKEDEIVLADEEVKKRAKIIYTGKGREKRTALTFDDGPDSLHTLQILDILDEYNIKATFFVIGRNAQSNPEVLKKIQERGHEIGNHSWSHPYLPKLSKASLEAEILNTEKVIKDIVGERKHLLFRPPYGAVKDGQMGKIAALGYHIVNWSVDTRDWEGISGDQMMEYVRRQLTPGGIILMHSAGNSESIQNTVEVLPSLIEWVLEQGYEFNTVSEILDLD